MITSFVFDLPTGAVADIAGQVPVYTIGLLIYGIGLYAYGLGSSFLHFTLSETTIAVGSALMSEALESLITNNIGAEDTKKVLAKEGMWSKLAMIPTALAGSVVAEKVGIQYPWFLSGVTAFVGFIIAVVTLRKYHTNTYHNGKKIWEHVVLLLKTIKEGALLVISKKQTRIVVLVTAGLAFATQSLNMFWGPIFQETSGSTWWLGSMWMFISLVTAFGTKISENINSTKRNFGLTLLSIGIPISLCILYPNSIVWLVSMFLLHEIGRGITPVITYPYFNECIPDDKRSTANSAKGSIERLARAIGLVIAGFLTNYFSLLGTWLISALLICGIGIWVLLMKE